MRHTHQIQARNKATGAVMDLQVENSGEVHEGDEALDEARKSVAAMPPNREAPLGWELVEPKAKAD